MCSADKCGLSLRAQIALCLTGTWLRAANSTRPAIVLIRVVLIPSNFASLAIGLILLVLKFAYGAVTAVNAPELARRTFGTVSEAMIASEVWLEGKLWACITVCSTNTELKPAGCTRLTRTHSNVTLVLARSTV